jgi:hypothetical protein
MYGEYSLIGSKIQRVDIKQSDEDRRKASKEARKALVRYPGEVVHHINGINTDNSADNLRVFKSQSEHMAFHHSLRQQNRRV